MSATPDAPTPRTEAYYSQWLIWVENGLGEKPQWDKFARALERELAQAQAEAKVLREALEGITKQVPCIDSRGCFYPVYGEDGECIGEQEVDPIWVFKGMAEQARAALARKEGEGV